MSIKTFLFLGLPPMSSSWAFCWRSRCWCQGCRIPKAHCTNVGHRYLWRYQCANGKWKFTMIMRRLFFFLAANSSFSPTSFYFLCSFFLPSIIYCLSLTRIGNCLFANSLTTTSTTIRRVVVAVMFFAWCLLQLLLLLSLALVEEVQLHSLVHHAAAHRENRRK